MNEIRDRLRAAFPPPPDAELRRDLWPQMLRKLAEQEVRVSWLDWALLFGSGVWLCVFPQALPALLYHL